MRERILWWLGVVPMVLLVIYWIARSLIASLRTERKTMSMSDYDLATLAAKDMLLKNNRFNVLKWSAKTWWSNVEHWRDYMLQDAFGMSRLRKTYGEE